jgi:hypothetical protein
MAITNISVFFIVLNLAPEGNDELVCSEGGGNPILALFSGRCPGSTSSLSALILLTGQEKRQKAKY